MKPHVILYTKENGREELSVERWAEFKTLAATFHRTDGPALEYIDGDKAWWIDDVRFSVRGYSELIQEVKDMPLVLRLVDPRWWVREFKECV